MWRKLEGGALQIATQAPHAGGGLGSDLGVVLDDLVHRLAVILFEHRLRIEGIHVRGAALAKDVNDALRFCREVRRARGERISRHRGLRAAQDTRQSQQAHAHSTARKKLAPRLRDSWTVIGNTHSCRPSARAGIVFQSFRDPALSSYFPQRTPSTSKI